MAAMHRDTRCNNAAAKRGRVNASPIMTITHARLLRLTVTCDENLVIGGHRDAGDASATYRKISHRRLMRGHLYAPGSLALASGWPWRSVRPLDFDVRRDCRSCQRGSLRGQGWEGADDFALPTAVGVRSFPEEWEEQDDTQVRVADSHCLVAQGWSIPRGRLSGCTQLLPPGRA